MDNNKSNIGNIFFISCFLITININKTNEISNEKDKEYSIFLEETGENISILK